MKVIRMYTGEDGESHFEELNLEMIPHGDAVVLSSPQVCHQLQFAETGSGGGYDWHNAPRRQYVITLCGTLRFENRLGDVQEIRPGDILLAEDCVGGGHKWKLIDENPWRRCYIHLDPSP